MVCRGWRCGFLGTLSLALAAQPIPETPPVPGIAGLPDLPELLPYRPRPMEPESPPAEPLTYRGERVLNTPEGWIIENGAIQSNELLLVANRIQYDPKTGHLTAEGSIRLEGQGIRLRCERLAMDWNKRSGEAWALVLEIEPDWTLTSEHVAFAGLKSWAFERVHVSACPQDEPGWSMTMSKLKLDLDHFATFRNATLSVQRMPVMYLPWGTYPAKAKRSSGLLPTLPSYSSVHGVTLALPYFQALGQTMDLTFNPEFHSKENPLWAGEFRWVPEPTHAGSFVGQYIDQKVDGEKRYRYQFRDLWQREDGWQFTADINQASDSLMEADYGRGVGGLGAFSFNSAAYLGKNFPLASFNVQASETRSFFQVEDDPFYQASFPASLRKQVLPELQSRLYPIEIGNFYFDAGVRAGRLAYRLEFEGSTPTKTYDWDREDVFARIQGRLGQWGPFRAELQTLLRATRYGASLKYPLYDMATAQAGSTLDPSFNPYVVEGGSIQRFLGSVRFQLSGPQIGRTFERFHLYRYRGEVKHLLEPYAAITETTRSGVEGRIPRFDDVDSRPGIGGSVMGERSLELGVSQHFMGRATKGDFFADLVRWKLSAKYHFRPILLSDGRYTEGWTSIDSDFEAEPSKRVRISFRSSTDIQDGSTDNALSVDVRTEAASRYSLALFSTAINRFVVRQRGIQLGGLQRFWDDRLRLEFQANHNFHRFISAQVALAYMTPCVATSIRFSRIALDTTSKVSRENRYDFVVSLRSLGDFSLFNK